MKHTVYKLLLIRLISVGIGIGFLVIYLFVGGCSHISNMDDVPDPISEFVTEYYPGMAYESFDNSEEGYRVKLLNGPAISFDNNFRWTNINGYGMRMPNLFLFNCMPPALYQYLEETANLGDVFGAERTAKYYRVTLLDSTVTYNISDASIVENVAGAHGGASTSNIIIQNHELPSSSAEFV